MKKLLLTFVILGLVVSPVLADLTSKTWIMDQSNEFADGVDYGSVTIKADTSTGKVEFTVDAFSNPYYNTSDSNFGIQSFGFNFTGVSAASTWTNLMLPTGWSQDNNGGNEDGFGNFMVTEDGTGSSRVNPLNFSFILPTFSQAVPDNFAVLSTGSTDQGHVLFAAHVAGFDNPQASSNYIGGSRVSVTPVPAPAAVGLGMIGLGLTGWVKRRFS